MMQVLQITTTPLKYEFDMEHARLEYNQDLTPTAKVETTPSEFKLNTKKTELNLDTYKARHSLGFRNALDFAKDASSKGSLAISEYTRTQVETGNKLASIEDGVTIGQVISQKMLEQPSSMVTAFLPNTGADISWMPPEIEMSFSPASTTYDWQTARELMSYIPGKMQMRILQYASVDITYVGSPLYVPPSSNPDYTELDVG